MARSNRAWGAAAHAMERDSEAVTAYEKALAIYDTLDDTFMLGWVYRMLGWSLLRLDEIESARSHFDAGNRLFAGAGDVSGVALHLRDYAEMAIAQHNYERAVVLAGTVQALADESGLGLIGISANQVEGLDQACEALGEELAGELFDEGREMSQTLAIRYAQS